MAACMMWIPGVLLGVHEAVGGWPILLAVLLLPPALLGIAWRSQCVAVMVPLASAAAYVLLVLGVMVMPGQLQALFWAFDVVGVPWPWW